MRVHLIKRLRKNQTPHEAKLWYNLRNRNLQGLKFRRQYKIGPYVVDFCSLKRKLVIEVDGGHHAEEINIIKDKIKEDYIKGQGYKVLRFWNSDIDENLDGVLEKILEVCGLLPNEASKIQKFFFGFLSE